MPNCATATLDAPHLAGLRQGGPMLTVWVTGCAGAGKGTVITHLVDSLIDQGHAAPPVLSDHVEVMAAVERDTGHRHHTHPFGDRRVDWLDTDCFTQALSSIADTLQHLAAVHTPLAIVELSRGRSHGPVDVSYARALQQLGPAVFTDNALAFRLQVDYHLRMARNAALGAPTPPHVMNHLYLHDDPAPMLQAGIRLHTIDGTHRRRCAALILGAINEHRHKPKAPRNQATSRFTTGTTQPASPAAGTPPR